MAQLRRVQLLFALLFLSGCQVVTHTFDSSADTHHSAWAEAEAQRLAPIYGTKPDLYTRFLNAKKDGPYVGWYDGFRITIFLYDEEGEPYADWRMHNFWWHEWNHHRHGDIRLDHGHNKEYTAELKAMGLWEYP